MHTDRAEHITMWMLRPDIAHDLKATALAWRAGIESRGSSEWSSEFGNRVSLGERSNG